MTRSQRTQRGAIAVEFALVLVPMLLIVFGITEFGRMMYQYNSLMKGVREAGRYLSTQAAGDRPDVILNVNTYSAARCLAVYGDPRCAGQPRVAGLATSMVAIQDGATDPATHQSQQTGAGTANLVSVTISGFTFRSLVNLPLGNVNLGAPDVTFDPISATFRQVL